ncbi:TolC family protein [Agrobacterium tumefaciens]|uniref:TolC family protein n=1 Tax=Agrobacterium tumefaciens TaxID=358 RepID=UPI001574D215|nr:TolC family protein [Agrobacterium tumefaciens]NSX88076.1 TolC family protein [Agrobacterium tumefaciens]
MTTLTFKLGAKLATALCLPFLLGGCVTAAQYASRDAGFTNVSARTSEATGKQAVWVQNRAEAQATQARVKSLMAAGKSLDVETAVQVALLNNKGLQAAYADLGESAATAWQSTMLVNPRVGIGLTGIGTPGLRAYQAIEGVVVTNILALATLKKNVEIADTGFRKAQLAAALKTLQLAADTRRAWITAVAAWENVGQLAQAQTAADAASELAVKLGEAGSLNKEGQAREQVFYAELTGQIARARLEARLAKEELTRLMGLWGADIEYTIPNRLPPLPKALTKRDMIEAEALQRRVDLQMAKLDLEATARSFKLTEATRYVTDLEIRSGFETERELEDGEIHKQTTGNAELEFVIPIFDSGQARMRESELAYMRAANLLAEKAVNVRSEARSAYQAYRSNYDIARHYRNSVVPLRTKIEEQSLLTYNGMITNTFELLADSREKVNSSLLAINAKRDFWLAEASLAPAIYGGGTGAAAGAETEVAAAGGGGGGH